jgi:hypothetical protein
MNADVKDRKKFWHTLQLDMDANLRPKLPAGVVGPFINSNFANVTAMIISVSSKERSYAEIESYVDKLEDGLKVIPMVSKINRSGDRDSRFTLRSMTRNYSNTVLESIHWLVRYNSRM